MRRIVTFDWLTADGYFAATDGSLDWVVPDDEQSKAAVASIPRFDTALFGRRTYEQFEGFWRHVDDDGTTASDPHRPGRRSPEHHAIAVWLNGVTKVVFSTTLEEAAWEHSHILRELDPGEIDAMKRRPGKDMIVFGSGSVVSELTRHGLVDEYQLVVCPVFLGDGWRLLDGGTKLELLETQRYPSGDVLLRYAPRGT